MLISEYLKLKKELKKELLREKLKKEITDLKIQMISKNDIPKRILIIMNSYFCIFN